jgi:hypothetical protein
MKRKGAPTYRAKKTLGPRKRIYKPTLMMRGTGSNVRYASSIQYQQKHLGGEIKSCDVIAPNGGGTQANFTFNTTDQLTCINLLTTGSSSWNRIGRKVSLKSVHVQGYFNPTTNGNVAYAQFARMLIIYDKQPNGSLPSISDVLRDQVNSATDSNVTLVSSGLNLNNKDRFEIIADERWILPGVTAAQTTGITTATCDEMHFEVYRKLKGREVHFKADSSPGVIGDIATGSLILITFGSLVSGYEPWNAQLSARVRFSDL